MTQENGDAENPITGKNRGWDFKPNLKSDPTTIFVKF